MNDDSPWLDDDQQRAWRRWLDVGRLVPSVLQRDLQATSGLSLAEFEVLVRLTEATSGRLRVSDLAAATGWERSRVSHQVTRMEKRGLVERQECPEDGRGAFVVVTQAGWAAIETAAPSHARTVRRIMFDALGPDRLASFDESLVAILDAIEDEVAAGPGRG